MNGFFRPTWAEISLDALRHNIEGFRKFIPSPIKIMAVVKADAYGHGAVEVSKEAVLCGVDYLAVAFLDEALELRKAGITAPILILGYTPPQGIAYAMERNITVTVYSNEVLNEIEKQVSTSNPLKIHIKIDTGMGRLGLHHEEDVTGFVDRARQIPGVRVEGLFTHYACADEADKSYTLEQHGKFAAIVQHYFNQGITFPYLHAGNSAAAIDSHELTYNMVRLGISMYGLYPSDEVKKHHIDLAPVMSFKTGVVLAKTLPPKSGVSYGTEYWTSDYEQIATLPVGYADGYSRKLAGAAEVLIRGERRPIIGRICMDQCMINITDLADVKPEEEVVLFGKQGSNVIPVEELARILGTINYEITCMVSQRVPRIYIRNGIEAGVSNRLLDH